MTIFSKIYSLINTIRLSQQNISYRHTGKLQCLNIVLLVSFSISSLTLAQEKPVKLQIPLKIEKRLHTLYLAPFMVQTSELAPPFIKETETLIHHALDLSGWYQKRSGKLQNFPPNEHTNTPPIINLFAQNTCPDGSSKWVDNHAQLCKANCLHFAIQFALIKEDAYFFLIARCFNTRNALARGNSAQISKSIMEFRSAALAEDMQHDARVILSLIDRINSFTVDAIPFLTSKIRFTHDTSSQNRPEFAHNRSVANKTSEITGHQFSTEIWESLITGSQPRALFSVPALVVSPVFFTPKSTEHQQGTKQKQESVFYVSYESGQPKIYLGSLNEKKDRVRIEFIARQITGLPGNQLSPALSPSQKELLLINDSSGNPEVWLQDLNLVESKAFPPHLYFEEKNATQATALWHPDGKKIIFVSSMGGAPRLYSLDFPRKKGSKPQLLTRQRGEATCPSISPDGKKIVYCVREPGRGSIRQLWVLDLETKTEKQITSGPGNKENPSWACDSHHIVFNMDFGQKSALYMIDLVKCTPILLTNFSSDVRFPQCSN